LTLDHPRRVLFLSFLSSGLQRAFRVVHVVSILLLHPGGRPAPLQAPLLGQPAAAAVVVATGREVADARRRNPVQVRVPADVAALRSASQDRHHAGGPREVRREHTLLKGFFKRLCGSTKNHHEEPFFRLRHLYRFCGELFEEMVL